MQQQRALTEQQLGLLSGNLARASPPPTCAPAAAGHAAGRPAVCQLLEARPDVRQAEAELIAANARIGVAKAALFPSISLTGNYGGESKELGDLLQTGSRIWSAGLGLNLPMFGFPSRLAARTDQARRSKTIAGRLSARTAERVCRCQQRTDQTALPPTARRRHSSAAAADKSLELSELRYKSVIRLSGGAGGARQCQRRRAGADPGKTRPAAGDGGAVQALGGGWQAGG